MTTVLDCIQRIPERLAEILRNYETHKEICKSYFKERRIERIRRFVFIANGSSYNSARAARLFLVNHCRIEAECKLSNMFVGYEAKTELAAEHEAGSGQTVYVVISQGGETKLVYEALELILKAGSPCIAITWDGQTSIARRAEFHLDMGCKREEFLYRTIGFSASVATCCLLGLAAAAYNGTVTMEEEAGYLADLKAVIRNLPEVERLTACWYEAHRFSLLRRNKLMAAGAGNLYPIAEEADIKLMEMVPMMTRSFELEEFIHGPQNAFDPDTIYFLLHHKGEDDEKAKAIARFLKEQIGFCVLVGEEPLEERDLRLIPAGRYFFGLEYVTVFQVIAYRMAVDRGRDLHRGVNGGISKYVTKTL